MKVSLRPLAAIALCALTGASADEPRVHPDGHRFFADDSFWNQPIPADAEVDPRSARWIQLLETEPSHENFLALTPAEKVRWHTDRTYFGHGEGFETVPIPTTASPDPKADSHMAVVDWGRNRVWDMWALSKNPDGTWKSATGMVYAADGPGAFSTGELGVKDGESVHFHGPSRAAGVPAVAGLIMYDEVMSGEIRHKIAAASRFCAYKEFVFPAAWTDGFVEGGIPEGSLLQLDPSLDLSKFPLTPEERVVCVALQRYGMVLVDIAQGQPVYAEGLWGHPGTSWKGKLRSTGGLSSIPYAHYRVLVTGNATRQGDGRSKFAPVWEGQ
jgi:hypothetical protein